MTKKEFLSEIRQEWYPVRGTFSPEDYPINSSISAAFFYRLVPNPSERKSPEFVYVKATPRVNFLEDIGFIAEWNMGWEAGHLRAEAFSKKIPDRFDWLNKYRDSNIYLLPHSANNNYYAHQHILNLLPASTREKFGLPRLKKGVWPSELRHWYLDKVLPRDFDGRLAKAFASHIWPLLNNSSSIKKYNNSEPLSVLAHNLNYWAPFLNQIIENYLLSMDFVKHENKKDEADQEKINRRMPSQIRIQRPRYGALVWRGQEEAWEVTKQLVDLADSKGKLRSIIDIVKSNRVQDDFSNLWSYDKEDFERKIYHKRNKVKVTFIEIDGSLPVHGPTAEVHEQLIWEDFFAVLNPKEKSIVVCLKNGITNLSEIGKTLGYSNHSPVSKALKKIRIKAKQMLDLK